MNTSFVGANPTFAECQKYIGQKVRKLAKNGKGKHSDLITPKPFKSGKIINTIKDVIIHPVLNIPAFTFHEDETFVEVRRCKVLKSNDDRNRYYGLNLLDYVEYSFNKNVLAIGLILELVDLDNNKVLILNETGGVVEAVAEWCKIKKKVDA